MTKIYDWILIGAGITGSALAYELGKLGLEVLLLDQSADGDIPAESLSASGHERDRATRYSYGGVHWYGNSGDMGKLFQEGKARHEQLSDELGMDTEYRPVNLLFTVDPGQDVERTIAAYEQMSDPFQILSPQEACEIEPLLNPEAIVHALILEQAQVNPILLNQAYQQAMIRQGGAMEMGEVQELENHRDRSYSVSTSEDIYRAKNVVVCAGGWTRQLLKQAGIDIPIYFTHAELIEILETNQRLSSFVIPSQTQLYQLETVSSRPELEFLWDEPGHELAPAIVDTSAVQFQDGRLLLGQLSRTVTDPQAQINPHRSEQEIRQKVGQVLPALAQEPGTWHSCLVAFVHQNFAIMGAVPNREGLYVFSGFTAPMTLVPAIAPRFARQLTGTPDPLLSPFILKSNEY